MRNDRRRIPRLLAGALVAVTVLSACSRREGRAAPTATLRTEPAPTSTTNPYAVPAVIDAAYLNRVLAALEHVVGDAARGVAASRTIPPDATERLRAVYLDPEFDEQLNLISDAVNQGLSGLAATPGDRKAEVVKIVSMRPDCVFLAASVDDTALAVRPVARTTEYYALQRRDPARDPRGYNPTPWAIPFEGFNKDGSAPSNPCATTSLSSS